MGRWTRLGTSLAVVSLSLIACASPGPRGTVDGGTSGSTVSGPQAFKRVTVAITADLTSPRSQLSRASGGTLPGARELEQLVHAGLAVEDEWGKLHPQLAEAVPTLENGLWTLSPDGRMETTWRIRPGARWHDGQPFSSEDLLFTARVAQDREFPLFGQFAYESVERIDAPDAATVLIRWNRPFIEADTMFSAVGTVQPVPLPKHLLEQPYLESRGGFMNLSYWGEEFVGAGPFRIREWMAGAHATLEAQDDYVLGRPKIDEIVVRFIPDPNTLVANILAGAVELPIGRGLSFDQTLQVREQWQAGRVEFTPGGAIKVWPQLNDPTPALVSDVRFRRAMFHAIDRQQLADTLMGGLSPVAHSIMIPTDAEFAATDRAVVRYDYDPRRASQMIGALGYSRGGDGIFRDGANQRLSVEIRATVIDILQKTVLAIADNWQKVGVATETHTITAGRQSDREYRSRFPSFDISRGNNSAESFKTFLSSEARVAETRYAGQNFPSYMSPDLDALINRYLVTIPIPERLQVSGEIVRHMSDQVIVLPMFYDVVGTMTGHRLVNVPTSAAQGKTTTWNAHLWDVRA